MTRAITITSGKGGVGKTSLSVNLAVSLAKQGYRVCLFDADLGLANINIMLRLSPQYTLADVIFQNRSLKDILVRHPDGIDIIPGSSGIEQMSDLSAVQVEELVHAFKQLDDYDFFIFDTSSGATRDVIAFCMAAYETVLVVTPEPTSLTDAYSLLKILKRQDYKGRVRVVVNQAKSSSLAKLAYKKFREVVEQHLQLRLLPLGIILRDDKLPEAVKHQGALVKLYPDSRAARSIAMIAKRLAEDEPGEHGQLDIDSFWRRCLDFFKRPVERLSGAPQYPAQTLTRESDVTGAPEGDVTAPASETAAFNDIGQQATPLINKLIDAVTVVSDELRNLRASLESGNTPKVADTGIQSADKTPVAAGSDSSLRQMIGEIISQQLEATGIGCEYALPDETPTLAMDDADVRRIVTSIIAYAVRMTPMHRSIGIEADVVNVTPGNGLSLKNGQYYRLTITDQGPGMTQSVLDELLLPGKSQTPSLLEDASSLLLQQGGCLTAESELEVGTRFCMHLPVSENQSMHNSQVS